MGGDKGEGETSWLITPTSILPRQGGGGCQGKYQKLRPLVGGFHFFRSLFKLGMIRISTCDDAPFFRIRDFVKTRFRLKNRDEII